MKTRIMTAIKPHRYGTRHLTAGEEYEAPMRHAIALVAAKKARFKDNKRRAAAKAADAPSEPQAMSLDALRLEATQLGINIDGRWGAARLQHEINNAKAFQLHDEGAH